MGFLQMAVGDSDANIVYLLFCKRSDQIVGLLQNLPALGASR